MRKVLALVLAFLMVFACVGALADSDEEVTLTFGKQFDFDGKTFLEGQDLENNYYLDYIYDQSKVKFEYAWVLDDDTQKDALAVANGDMPDVMKVNLTTFNMLIESDMIQPLTDVFEEYASDYMKSARDFYTEAFEAATVGGELMAIPNTATKKAHQYIWVRQDWLDKVGIEIGDTLTMDEIVTIAKAFIEQDPDGNGENDTIGMTMDPTYMIGRYQSDYEWDRVCNLMGSYPRMWYEGEDGKVVYGSVTPETRNALEYLASLYKEGIIDPQFAVRDQKEQVVSGKCGIFFGCWCAGPLNQSFGYDQADWIPVVGPVDEDGNFYVINPVPASEYVVVSKNCEHPEAVIKAIAAEYDFHRLLTGDEEWTTKCQEYQTAGVNWTIMPIDIQIENGDIIAQRGIDMVQMIDNNGDRTGVSLENQSFYDAYLKFLEDPSYLTGWARYKGMYLGCNVENYEKNVVTSPVFWGMTDSMQDYWTTLTSLEDETFMKIIMNEVGIEAFDEFVNRWYAEGGSAIVDEVQEYVDARK